jgi:hypothetical protein
LTLLALLDFPIIAEVRQQPKQPVDRSNAVSHRQREEMVDCGEGDQQGDAQPQASADQLLLDRQQRLDRRGAQFLADVVLRHDGAFPVSTDGRRRNPAEEQPGNRQPHPDNEARDEMIF